MFNLNEIIIIVIFLCLEFLKISQNIRVNFTSLFLLVFVFLPLPFEYETFEYEEVNSCG